MIQSRPEPGLTSGPLYRAIEAGRFTVRGKDGRLHVLRPIQPSDADSLMRGYDALSDRAKWFRMLHSLPHLSHDMAERFSSPDPSREFCVVLEGHDALSKDILGGARISLEPSGESAEFSVSLRPEAQGLGLARQSLETALAVAREGGVKRVWGIIAHDNYGMLKLARRIGFELHHDPEDLSLVRAEIDLERLPALASPHPGSRTGP